MCNITHRPQILLYLIACQMTLIADLQAHNMSQYAVSLYIFFFSFFFCLLWHARNRNARIHVAKEETTLCSSDKPYTAQMDGTHSLLLSIVAYRNNLLNFTDPETRHNGNFGKAGTPQNISSSNFGMFTISVLSTFLANGIAKMMKVVIQTHSQKKPIQVHHRFNMHCTV